MLGLHRWFKGTSQVAGTSVIMTCRLWCPVACRILVPWPGIEPMSLALQDRFLTIGPPRKSQNHLFWFNFRSHSTSLLFFHLLRQSKKFYSTSREEEIDCHLFMGDSKVLEEHFPMGECRVHLRTKKEAGRQPREGEEGSLFSTSLPIFVTLGLFDDSHSDICETISHCGFGLHFSDD